MKMLISESRWANRWSSTAHFTCSPQLSFGAAEQTNAAEQAKESNSPPITADTLRTEAEKHLESRGYKDKKPKAADTRSTTNLWLMAGLALSSFGSFWGINGLVKGPDMSQFPQEKIEAMNSVRNISCNQFDTVVSSLPTVLSNSESFRKMPQQEQQRVISQAQQRMKEGHDLLHYKSDFTVTRTLAAIPTTIISLILIGFIISGQTSGEDKSLSMIKNMALFPKKWLDNLRLKQFEVVPLNEFEQKSLMTGVEAVATKTRVMADRIQHYADENTEFKNSLIQAYGTVPTAETLAAGFVRKTMDAMLTENTLPTEPWTHTKKFNEWTVVKNMLERIQETEQTGFLLDSLTDAVSDAAATTHPELQKQAELKRIHAHLANHTLGYYHSREAIQRLQNDMNQVTGTMNQLIADNPGDLELKLVAYHQRQNDLQTRLNLLFKEEKVTLLVIQRSQQELSEFSSREFNQAEAALKRALSKGSPNQERDLDQIIEKLECDKAIAQVSAEQRSGLSGNSLAEIKAGLELTRRLNPESQSGNATS